MVFPGYFTYHGVRPSQRTLWLLQRSQARAVLFRVLGPRVLSGACSARLASVGESVSMLFIGCSRPWLAA